MTAKITTAVRAVVQAIFLRDPRLLAFLALALLAATLVVAWPSAVAAAADAWAWLAHVPAAAAGLLA